MIRRSLRLIVNNLPDAGSAWRARRWLMDLLPDSVVVSLDYRSRFGRFPNLSRPRTFTEKIQWRKLHQHDARFPVFADKVAVKAEVERLIGSRYITPTLWVGTDPAMIPFDDLTPPYVVKVNHASGWNSFVQVPSDLDRAALVRTVAEQLNGTFGSALREWAYARIPRRVLIERMIVMPDGRLPEDYKYFVYHGRVHFIQVDSDRFENHTRSFYDRDWKPIPGRLHFPSPGEPVPRPASLAEMIEVAEQIAAQFDFARVDLYATNEGVRFGEVTFYPGSGLEHFVPPSLDALFGAPWMVGVGPVSG